MQRVFLYFTIVLIGLFCIRFLPAPWRKVILTLYFIGFFYYTFLSREAQPHTTIILTYFRNLRSAVTLNTSISDFLKLLFTGGGLGEATFDYHKLGSEPILNILLFMPLGYLLPSIFNFFKHKPWFTVIAGFLLSLTTELLQLVTRLGSFDVDDLINNTLGSVIGVILYYLVLKKVQRTEVISKHKTYKRF